MNFDNNLFHLPDSGMRIIDLLDLIGPEIISAFLVTLEFPPSDKKLLVGSTSSWCGSLGTRLPELGHHTSNVRPAFIYHSVTIPLLPTGVNQCDSESTTHCPTGPDENMV